MTPLMSSEKDYIVHLNPVWRERANYIVDAKLEAPDSRRQYEQLWARRVDHRHFEICCIPFFLYDVNLGDEVATRAEGDRLYVVEGVVTASNRYTFRVWFGESSAPNARNEVVRQLGETELLEWYSTNLLAVDAPTIERAQSIADYLETKERERQLMYETGRTA